MQRERPQDFPLELTQLLLIAHGCIVTSGKPCERVSSPCARSGCSSAVFPSFVSAATFLPVAWCLARCVPCPPSFLGSLLRRASAMSSSSFVRRAHRDAMCSSLLM